MNPILKKLIFKGQSPVLLISAPVEFKATAAEFGVPVHEKPKVSYRFALAFVKSLTDADAVVASVRPALEEGAVFWLAYPKGTSKQYKDVGINRDIVNAHMDKKGYQCVTMVAIDADWSAMRFKRLN